MDRVYVVDVSNLLNRWFFYADYYNFMNFMKKSEEVKEFTIPEIVREWNDKYAKHPRQYVFCK